jgi:hypothetical protein
MPRQPDKQAFSLDNGPMPVDPSISLWRYVSLPALLLYLEGRLSLSSVRELRRMDPQEGVQQWDHITHADAFSSEEYGELREYVKSLLSPQQLRVFELNKEYPGANQQELFRRWHKILIATRYALCFFHSRHESIAMWRLFAPKGFAIHTSLDCLESALKGTNRAWRISRIRYWDKSTEIVPDDTHNDPELRAILRYPHLLKGMEYKYENEVRLCTVDSAARSHLMVENVPPETWIQEIRVSPDIWHEDAELLRKLIADRCPAIKNQIVSSPLTLTPSFVDNFEEQLNSDMSKIEAADWPAFLHKP